MVDSVEVKIEPMEESKEVKKEPVTLEAVEEPIEWVIFFTRDHH